MWYRSSHAYHWNLRMRRLLPLDDFDLNSPPTATTEMLEYCLSAYFQFGKCKYQQIKGTPMGTPISGLITEAVLQRPGRLMFAVIAQKGMFMTPSST